MGVRILDSECGSTETGAVLLDSVTGWAFGPVFDDHDEAAAFLQWLRTPLARDYDDPTMDVRALADDDLSRLFDEWRAELAAVSG